MGVIGEKDSSQRDIDLNARSVCLALLLSHRLFLHFRSAIVQRFLLKFSLVIFHPPLCQIIILESELKMKGFYILNKGTLNPLKSYIWKI